MRRALHVSLAIVVPLITSCGPGTMATRPTVDVELNGPSKDQCKLAKDPLNPLIVEWPGTNKVGLDSQSRRGVVIVKFDGCSNLKVLTQCEAKGTYEAETVTPARDKMEIKNKNDLFALLPLGALSLGGAVDSGTKFLLDYVAVGQREYKGEAPSTTGICDGATHYVRRITIGAYSLDAEEEGSMSGGANAGKIGIGGSHDESDKRHKASGDPNKCESSPTSSDCNAPIQLELTPLPGASPAKPVASAG
jgi:hypothetical protein